MVIAISLAFSFENDSYTYNRITLKYEHLQRWIHLTTLNLKSVRV